MSKDWKTFTMTREFVSYRNSSTLSNLLTVFNICTDCQCRKMINLSLKSLKILLINLKCQLNLLPMGLVTLTVAVMSCLNMTQSSKPSVYFFLNQG